MTTLAIIGGIGCGKSTVTALLEKHGAKVVDADAVAREVVEPGSPVLERLAAVFGDEVLTAEGRLDRAALAAVAFANPASTAQMNELLHPAIGEELVRQVRIAQESTEVVVVAIPLFRTEHRQLLGIDTVVCVDCDANEALERLVAQRGFTTEDAQLRMAAQGTREERLSAADEVLSNTGTHAELAASVDELWERLVSA